MLPVALVIAALAFVSRAQYLCTYNVNFNVTSPDIAPAQYAVSSYDCCQMCWQMNGCVTSVYYNYYCHFKDSNTVVDSIGATVVLPVGTPPPQPTTQRPVPPPPPPQPTTEQPTPKPPRPTTKAPTPAPPQPTTAAPQSRVTMVLHKTCQSSSTCSHTQDGTCVQTAVRNRECRPREQGGSRKYVCAGSRILRNDYTDGSCKSSPTTTVKQNGVCTQTPNYEFEEYQCASHAAPVPNHPLYVVENCQNSCTDSTCTTSQRIGGQCNNGIMWLCYGSLAVRRDYVASSCSGAYQTTSFNSDVCYQTANYGYFEVQC